ncbi:putative dna damage response protein wss1 [Golovinomyces cichoracearum]|uniref:Putative dna damage response protein wss1 n=1 Tax=Golovinomyces cichoracearum TaxID=62708 RepID=A0A420IRD2_9PEZI|nr:putative dna damage response protein wss1 [Golovinomyces cichoracearum]
MYRNAPILRYSHLNKLPREKEALLLLKKVAYLVKPIMKARKWNVGTLAEFLPSEQKLLGINMNHGERICLRLRYATDQNNFLPFEQIIDVMLHELCHNVYGPHGAQFHALWDQLRTEYEDLLSRSDKENEFPIEGKIIPKRVFVTVHEAMEKARKAAVALEQRRTQKHRSSRNSGCRFSSKTVQSLSNIRTVVTDAIQRRVTVLNGCGASSRTNKEIEDLAIQATRNGVASQAEEETYDRANSLAIWELLQEDIANQREDIHLPLNKDFSSIRDQSIAVKKSHVTISGKISGIPIRQPPKKNVPQANLRHSSNTNSVQRRASMQDLDSNTRSRVFGSGWDCPSCTLHNPVNFLTCDACYLERPMEIKGAIPGII